MKELKILQDQLTELKLRLDAHREDSLKQRRQSDAIEDRLMEDMHFNQIRIKNIKEIDSLIPERDEE